VRISGSLPGAALSTGHLPTVASVGLAGLLLAWGILELPELSTLRSKISRIRPRPLLAPLALGGLSLLGLWMVEITRPDGRLHVSVLPVAPGEAVLVRGPSGKTALVASGPLDRYALLGAVGERLAVWEHGLDVVAA